MLPGPRIEGAENTHFGPGSKGMAGDLRLGSVLGVYNRKLAGAARLLYPRPP